MDIAEKIILETVGNKVTSFERKKKSKSNTNGPQITLNTFLKVGAEASSIYWADS